MYWVKLLVETKIKVWQEQLNGFYIVIKLG